MPVGGEERAKRDAPAEAGEPVPFNRPPVTGLEAGYMAEAMASGQLAGNGAFTRRAEEWLEDATGAPRVLLTGSCTLALEMAAMLIGLGPGDELIMPSFTFVSTANPAVLREATPVFVDIRSDTLNLDEERIEQAITPRTRGIVPVHYAGVSCDVQAICDLAAERGIPVVEDAAQCLLATADGRHLGTAGALGALSFHDTKNVTCGEGGALLVNDPELVERAEIVYEKGTNRNAFTRGLVEKYTWVDAGSSCMPSELTAAFLCAQLERAREITARRREIWDAYDVACADLERTERARRPVVPPGCEHNGHLYYLLLPGEAERDGLIDGLARRGIQAPFHYVPLHGAPAGQRFGRVAGDLSVTESAAARLIRLPLWVDMTDAQVERVVDAVHAELA
jgi:dTDP-4-amino-4,6-dideoxygalactose transaminase